MSIQTVDLDDRTLVALMAAIIHRPGEDRVEAVEAAKHILELVEVPGKRKQEAEKRFSNGMKRAEWWDFVEGRMKE